MKVYSIFIIFCFFQTLICDKPGVTQESLQEAFTTSLPFIKSFHPLPFVLSGSSLREAKFSFTELNSNNIQFSFDEFGLLHLKFVNLNGKVKGTTFTEYSHRIPHIKYNWFMKTDFCDYTAELSNINWEETYSIESTKKADGKYKVKYKGMTDSKISYKIFGVNGPCKDKEGEVATIKFQITKLDFDPFKSYLKKISGLILETLQNIQK